MMPDTNFIQLANEFIEAENDKEVSNIKKYNETNYDNNLDTFNSNTIEGLKKSMKKEVNLFAGDIETFYGADNKLIPYVISIKTDEDIYS